MDRDSASRKRKHVAFEKYSFSKTSVSALSSNIAPTPDTLLPDIPAQYLIPSCSAISKLRESRDVRLSTVSQATVVYLLTHALGRGCFAEAARCAATLLPEARVYPRTVSSACSRLFSEAASSHPTSATLHRDDLLEVQQLLLDGERMYFSERTVAHTSVRQPFRLEGLLCGIPPSQLAQTVPQAFSSRRFEGKIVRACAAARAYVHTMLHFPGCPPLLTKAEETLKGLLQDGLHRGCFESDPHLHALLGVTMYLKYLAQLEVEEGDSGGAKDKLGPKGSRKSLQLLSLNSPMVSSPGSSLKKCTPPHSPHSFSSTAARLLSAAEVSLRFAVKIVAGCVSRARSCVEEKLSGTPAGVRMSQEELRDCINVQVFPWVEPLAGFPLLLQRILNEAGRDYESQQMIKSFLLSITGGSIVKDKEKGGTQESSYNNKRRRIFTEEEEEE